VEMLLCVHAPLLASVFLYDTLFVSLSPDDCLLRLN
jgi:hypothetical protein